MEKKETGPAYAIGFKPMTYGDFFRTLDNEGLADTLCALIITVFHQNGIEDAELREGARENLLAALNSPFPRVEDAK